MSREDYLESVRDVLSDFEAGGAGHLRKGEDGSFHIADYDAAGQPMPRNPIELEIINNDNIGASGSSLGYDVHHFEMTFSSRI
jgi:hypothetical protein